MSGSTPSCYLCVPACQSVLSGHLLDSSSPQGCNPAKGNHILGTGCSGAGGGHGQELVLVILQPAFTAKWLRLMKQTMAHSRPAVQVVRWLRSRPAPALLRHQLGSPPTARLHAGVPLLAACPLLVPFGHRHVDVQQCRLGWGVGAARWNGNPFCSACAGMQGQRRINL